MQNHQKNNSTNTLLSILSHYVYCLSDCSETQSEQVLINQGSGALNLSVPQMRLSWLHEARDYILWFLIFLAYFSMCLIISQIIFLLKENENIKGKKPATIYNISKYGGRISRTVNRKLALCMVDLGLILESSRMLPLTLLGMTSENRTKSNSWKLMCMHPPKKT